MQVKIELDDEVAKKIEELLGIDVKEMLEACIKFLSETVRVVAAGVPITDEMVEHFQFEILRKLYEVSLQDRATPKSHVKFQSARVFRCSACGAKMVLKDLKRGDSVKCAKCGAEYLAKPKKPRYPSNIIIRAATRAGRCNDCGVIAVHWYLDKERKPHWICTRCGADRAMPFYPGRKRSRGRTIYI